MESGSDQTLSIQWVEPLDWREDGMEMTYDMEVVGPYHNFVAGSVVVHNSVNEYSARYSILDNEFYIPEIQEITAQSTTNKQGRGEMLEGVLASEIRSKMQAHSQLSYNLYEWLLSDDVDLTRELARINLPPNIYTQWVWKTDLHNLFHFLMLKVKYFMFGLMRLLATSLSRKNGQSKTVKIGKNIGKVQIRIWYTLSEKIILYSTVLFSQR